VTNGTSSSDSEREAKAKLEKAEADARNARATAEKAEQEQADWNTELARQQRDAEKRKAIAEAEKAARDAAQTLDPALERQKREAEAKKSVAEAEKATADARRAQISALVPDLSKVERGETTVTGSQPLFSSVLAHRALDGAVADLVERVLKAIPEGDTVLVTSDSDLATSDAAYLEVNSGLEQLIAAADELKSQAEQRAVGAIVGALAAAIPPVLSLLSAHRAVSSNPVTVDDTTATAVVAGGLTASGRTIRLDDFRLVPTGRIVQRAKDLGERRSSLIELKLTKEQDRNDLEAQRVSADQRISELKKTLEGLEPESPEGKRVRSSLEEEGRNREEVSVAVKDLGVIIGLIDSLISSIDAFSTAIHAVPEGAKRSPLVSASLREEAHGEDSTFSRILFVKASAGSVDQVFSDRPLWSKDKFASIASVSVSYWMIDTATSDVLSAGLAKGSAMMSGSIGGSFSIDPQTS
jgi:hypothetical protein